MFFCIVPKILKNTWPLKVNEAAKLNSFSKLKQNGKAKKGFRLGETQIKRTQFIEPWNRGKHIRHSAGQLRMRVEMPRTEQLAEMNLSNGCQNVSFKYEYVYFITFACAWVFIYLRVRSALSALCNFSRSTSRWQRKALNFELWQERSDTLRTWATSRQRVPKIKQA